MKDPESLIQSVESDRTLSVYKCAKLFIGGGQHESKSTVESLKPILLQAIATGI